MKPHPACLCTTLQFLSPPSTDAYGLDQVRLKITVCLWCRWVDRSRNRWRRDSPREGRYAVPVGSHVITIRGQHEPNTRQLITVTLRGLNAFSRSSPFATNSSAESTSSLIARSEPRERYGNHTRHLQQDAKQCDPNLQRDHAHDCR